MDLGLAPIPIVMIGAFMSLRFLVNGYMHGYI
ncbi:hypothetical protein HCH_05267 [Hahella chejuensis KCTC 2396]|uniref:Uncharacterized protein n=1 Tax=Hahella chejuensis (strain KCTC 2396) TaxID=349521 RepID=Q2SBN2_HAHCH|nr:hypothetical protein HCH_05267 [Hahella chejuensis KCTC 2396]